MKVVELLLETWLREAAYKGNIGMMEFFRFQNEATTEEKALMRKYLELGEQEKAWQLLQKVLGIKLK